MGEESDRSGLGEKRREGRRREGEGEEQREVGVERKRGW